MAAWRRDQEGRDRLRGALRHPRGRPSLNAFTLGAQATHPGAKVKIVWTNAWFSPPKETPPRRRSSPPAST
jgi:hypothetical protein